MHDMRKIRVKIPEGLRATCNMQFQVTLGIIYKNCHSTVATFMFIYNHTLCGTHRRQEGQDMEASHAHSPL